MTYEEILKWFESNWVEFIIAVKDANGQAVGYIQQKDRHTASQMLLALAKAHWEKEFPDMPFRISTPGFELPVVVKAQPPGGGGGGGGSGGGQQVIPIPPINVITPYVPPVLPENQPPYATDLTVDVTLRAGVQAKFSYQYNDHESDPEGETFCELLRAESNGTFSTLATSVVLPIYYTPTLSDIGHELRYQVTPVATAGPLQGETVGIDTGAVQQPITDAPKITGITISGGSSPPEVGETIHATIDGYSASTVGGVMIPEGDHEYQWQYSPDGVTNWLDLTGETNPFYTVKSTVQSRYLRCGVIPHAQYGTALAGAQKYSSSTGKVPTVSPPSSSAWWPTIAAPTQGWGANAHPRCVSPVSASRGPHPHASLGYTSYCNMLAARNDVNEINRHIGNMQSWIPGIDTTLVQTQYWPGYALSTCIILGLYTEGATGVTDSIRDEAIAKAEAYFQLVDLDELVIGNTQNAGSWTTRNSAANWPAGGQATADVPEGSIPTHWWPWPFMSHQILAMLWGHFKDLVSTSAQDKAKAMAWWYMMEWRYLRVEWDEGNHASPPHWHAKHENAIKESCCAGIPWLLGEFYDHTDADHDWPEMAEFCYSAFYDELMGWLRLITLGEADVESDDLAGWTTVDYIRGNEVILTFLMCLEILTGEDHFTVPHATIPTFMGNWKYTALYRTMPDSDVGPWTRGPGWNQSQERQANFWIQCEHLAYFLYSRLDDPYFNDIVDKISAGVPINKNPYKTLEQKSSGGNIFVPWWYFCNPSPTLTDYNTLPLSRRWMAGSYAIHRTAHAGNPDDAFFSYRTGNAQGHHIYVHPGDMMFYHRGNLLPRMDNYRTFWGSPCQWHLAKYHGIHIFDPNDISAGYGLSMASHPLEPIYRDGGPKRIFEPYYPRDCCHSNDTSLGAVISGNAKWSRYQQAIQRMTPESNHDMEQSRCRQRGKGTVSGVLYHYESTDWTPMFRKWPYNVDYTSPTPILNINHITNAYHIHSRTDRVIHPNGWIRTIIWLNPGGGSVLYPPCIIVYDQVETLDSSFAVENHWWAINQPVHQGTNHYTFTDERLIQRGYMNWAWETISSPPYAQGTDFYQYDGILHHQLWHGNSALAATGTGDVAIKGGDVDGPSHVIQDGILSGNSPIQVTGIFNPYGVADSPQTSGNPNPNGVFVAPWDPQYGPVECGAWYLAVKPAVGNANYRFLNVMNSDANSGGHGPYSVGVVDGGSTITITVGFASGTRTVVINTATFAVNVT